MRVKKILHVVDDNGIVCTDHRTQYIYVCAECSRWRNALTSFERPGTKVAMAITLHEFGPIEEQWSKIVPNSISIAIIFVWRLLFTIFWCLYVSWEATWNWKESSKTWIVSCATKTLREWLFCIYINIHAYKNICKQNKKINLTLLQVCVLCLWRLLLLTSLASRGEGTPLDDYPIL